MINSTFIDIIPTATRYRRNAFIIKQTSKQKHIIESEEKPASNASNAPQRPRFALSRNTNLPFDPITYLCRNKHTAECQNKTKEFAQKVLSEFRKSIAQKIEEPNFYNVYDAMWPSDRTTMPSVCMLLEAGVRTLRQKDASFSTHAIGVLLPKRKLFSRKSKDTNSCVIVSSAGSLVKSNLGHFIGN